MTILDFLGLKPETVQLAIAGVLGGLVRALTLRNGLPDALIAIVVGGICAVYGSGLVIEVLGSTFLVSGLPAESINGLSGFMAGVGGITFSGLLLDGWKFVLTRFFKKIDPPAPAAPIVPTTPESGN